MEHFYSYHRFYYVCLLFRNVYRRLCRRMVFRPFRKEKGLILVVTFFSFFSLLSSLAWNPEILGVFRFLTSLGIGATTIVASTYISEFFPSATKGKYQAICITIGICGIPAAGWVAKLVVPSASYGWRFIFLFGAVGIFFR